MLTNKCSGSCNTLDNPMSKICVPKIVKECTGVINETMINNKDNITNNINTYLILFIVFLIGFIVFLIGFIYYCRRSNFDRKKLKDFLLSKSKNFDLLNYKNGYKFIRNKRQN